MNSPLGGFLRLAVFGTPILAGLALLLVAFSKDLRPALPAGFIAALLFGMIGGALVSDSFGRSGMGADWGAMLATVLMALYASAGFLFGLGVAACASPKHRVVAPFAFITGLALPIGLPCYRAHSRGVAERRWLEKQERQRENPHALVNDVALPDAQDSGYRIRFVDYEGVVRANSDIIRVVPYVVLPPGKHRLLLKADTEKGERMKLPWTVEQTVEVEAGRLYQLEVKDGRVALIGVLRFKGANPEGAVSAQPETGHALNKPDVK